jgi:hypothetical protein
MIQTEGKPTSMNPAHHPDISCKLLGTTEQHRHLSYPHTHGFFKTEPIVILAQREHGGERLVLYHLETGEEQPLYFFPECIQLYYDAAHAVPVLLAIHNQQVLIVDLMKHQSPQCLYNATQSERLGGLGSITSDGSRVALYKKEQNRYHLLQLDITTGLIQTICTKSWEMGHVQFAPTDAHWIGFCHEGETTLISDRIWAWHPETYPDGACVFNQSDASTAAFLNVGHERWCIHDRLVDAVVYGVSPVGPRGVYEINPHTQTYRIISSGERDWHCNSSYDGAWLVVDTSGPYDQPGRGWEQAGSVSDIILIHRATGKRHWLARCHHGPQHHHPHPAFSPDGNWIVFNDYPHPTDQHTFVYALKISNIKKKMDGSSA